MFCLVSSLTQVILMFFAILTYFLFVRFPVVQVTSGDSSGIKWPEPDTSAAAGGQFLAPICPGALVQPADQCSFRGWGGKMCLNYKRWVIPTD